MNKFYREGDHLVICDVSGQKALRSECVKQWNGLIVKKEFAEPRHPLDRQRMPAPERTVVDARPPGEDVFLNPGDVTADDL